MKKKLICLILALTLTAVLAVPALAANSETINFINNSETIDLTFSDVATRSVTTQTGQDGTIVTVYELTIPKDSTLTVTLHPGVGGRYTISSEDGGGKKIEFDGGTFTAAELDTLVFTYLSRIDQISQAILSAQLAGSPTAALDAELASAQDQLSYYMTLREKLKNALTFKTKYPSQESGFNTALLRETTYKFIRTGEYTLSFTAESAAGCSLVIKLTIVEASSLPAPDSQPADDIETTPDSDTVPALAAIPTMSTVYVDGIKTEFDAYNIGGNNYFKLRDLAFVLSGSTKQFDVTWDDATGTMNLISGKPYTVFGGEMSARGTENKTPLPTNAIILLNGEEVSLTAYNIDGNNYFKLRDIGCAFDFNVSFNSEDNAVIVATTESYTDN